MSVLDPKPLGIKAYGSIPHLPGSRNGTGDKGLTDGQYAICAQQARDRRDVITVQAKLDGSNVAVCNLDGQILALTRAGYLAQSSKYEMHQLFACWVREREHLFNGLLYDREWISGEWLAQAHGTKYDLTGREPFVAFDLFVLDRKGQRSQYAQDDFYDRICPALTVAPVLCKGGPCSIERALALLGDGKYGEIDSPEGVIWRVERDGKPDFMAKYVRPDKVDGCYLEDLCPDCPIWNWRPDGGLAA